MANSRNNNRNSNQSNNRNNNGNSNQNSNDKPTKRTFCSAGVGPKSGNRWVSGANYYKDWEFIAGPYSGSHITTSENGIEWQNWVAEFKIKGFPQPGVTPCLYNMKTGNLHFDKLQMVAKPGSPNGGYFGRFKKD